MGILFKFIPVCYTEWDKKIKNRQNGRDWEEVNWIKQA